MIVKRILDYNILAKLGESYEKQLVRAVLGELLKKYCQNIAKF